MHQLLLGAGAHMRGIHVAGHEQFYDLCSGSLLDMYMYTRA